LPSDLPILLDLSLLRASSRKVDLPGEGLRSIQVMPIF
jgi:hypothetical protein